MPNHYTYKEEASAMKWMISHQSNKFKRKENKYLQTLTNGETLIYLMARGTCKAWPHIMTRRSFTSPHLDQTKDQDNIMFYTSLHSFNYSIQDKRLRGTSTGPYGQRTGTGTFWLPLLVRTHVWGRHPDMSLGSQSRDLKISILICVAVIKALTNHRVLVQHANCGR